MKKNCATAWQQWEKGKAGNPGSSGAAKSLPCQDPLKELHLWAFADQQASLLDKSGPLKQQPDVLLASEMKWIQTCWKKRRRNPRRLHLTQLLSMHYLLLLGQWLCSQPIKATVITSLQ